MQLRSALPILIYVLTTAGGLILLKLGSKNHAIVEFISGRPALHPTIENVAGIVLYATSFALYTFLIAKNDLGVIVPLTTGLVYILVFIASFTIFKEAFTPLKIVAIVLILGGVILLNMNSTK